MIYFGRQTSWSILKRSDDNTSAYVSFDVAKFEAENASKNSRCEYHIYKLVAIVTPKPVEVETKILPEQPPAKGEQGER